jgi:N,N'-diacetyllegionaminate synthase
MDGSKPLIVGDEQFDDLRAMIIAEVAQAHDGSLGMAHAYIDAAADCGANAVKFQTHIAEAESTPREGWRVKFSAQEDSRYDYWKRMEFTQSQWEGLKTHAEERGLIFLSSPFSLAAVELLSNIGIQAWKVASGEVTNLPLLERLRDSRLPVLLSTGLSSFDELDRAVQILVQKGGPLALMHCTTAYPCPAELVGLNQISQIRARYGLPVGLSDHSGVIAAGIAAATIGISVLEVHVTFHRKMFGPDVVASLTFEELGLLVQSIRFVERAKAHPTDRDYLAGQMSDVKKIFGKSIVAKRDLCAGGALVVTDLAFKKPGDGLPANRYPELLGRYLKRDLKKDELILFEDLA